MLSAICTSIIHLCFPDQCNYLDSAGGLPCTYMHICSSGSHGFAVLSHTSSPSVCIYSCLFLFACFSIVRFAYCKPSSHIKRSYKNVLAVKNGCYIYFLLYAKYCMYGQWTGYDSMCFFHLCINAEKSIPMTALRYTSIWSCLKKHLMRRFKPLDKVECLFQVYLFSRPVLCCHRFSSILKVLEARYWPHGPSSTLLLMTPRCIFTGICWSGVIAFVTTLTAPLQPQHNTSSWRSVCVPKMPRIL